LDSKALRNCFGNFATGVTVVTWKSGEQDRSGITVNSFTSVSLDPPLVLVSIDRKAKACEAMKGQPFVVNILASHQQDIAWQFAGRPQIDLEMEWEDTEVGPKIKGVLAAVECEPWQSYDGGDHILFLGKVKAFTNGEGHALMFYKGKFYKSEEMESKLIES
jgi:flavin reductase (DIM6/NTAB) family NADH-FMN oxidoreductase RutF